MAMSNPFHYGRPVEDRASFYGRRQLLEEAIDLVARRQGISLVGPSRIGKTSFLRQLAQVLRERHPEILCIPFDCAGWQSETRAGMQRVLLDELDRAAGIETPDLPPQLEFRDFRRAVRERTQRHGGILYLFDDLDELAQNHELVASRFFEGLRSLGQEYLTYVAATVDALPLAGESGAPDDSISPFGNDSMQMPLRLLEWDEAFALLEEQARRGGVAFPPRLITLLLFDLAGPHPFYLKMAGWYAFDQLSNHGGRLGEEGWDEVRTRFLDEAIPHWERAWGKLSQSDREYLAFLAINQWEDGAAVRRLRQACVVREEQRHLVPLSRAFERFVARQSVFGRPPAPPVTMDIVRRIVLVDGQPVRLPLREFDLLDRLTQDPEQAVGRRELIDLLWDDGDYGQSGQDRLKGQVKELRNHLRQGVGGAARARVAKRIEAVRSIGYRFLPDLSW
jgi:DNA-binding winged helix-turn-helix (wHTH) protein